ncbi:MAG: acetyltransferase [Eubacterium sp.]|nr:acetyltransferase [Eubacterium sp.]
MSKSVIIIGASGHGKVIADIIIRSGDKVVGFLDDGVDKGTLVVGVEVLGKIEDYKNFPDCEFVIAIGNPYVRKKIADLLSVKWYTAIHPTAVISSLDADIGAGTAIMANAVINPGVKIGRHCIINTGAVVEHDNVLRDFVHISPKAVLAGTVSVGQSTHIGVGAVVINNVSITSNCIIGGGSAVVKDITESGTYVGVPARRIK